MKYLPLPSLCIFPISIIALIRIEAQQPVYSKARVVVIGAGAAGLTATQRLLGQNFDVVLLEASQRWGGRLWSTPVTGGWLELGGQWVHGNCHVLYNFASSRGLLKPERDQDEPEETFKATGGNVTEAVSEQYGLIYEKINSIAQELDEFSVSLEGYQSAGAYFLRKYSEMRNSFSDVNLADQVYDAFSRGQKTDVVPDSLHDLALESYIDGNQVGPEETDLNIPYTKVLEQFISPEAIKRVQFNNYVKQIRLAPSPQNRMLQVITANGQVYDADHVIVTASMGHLKERMTSLFSPPLSLKKQDAIRAVGYGTLGKIHLVYDHPWWNDIDEEMSLLNLLFDNDVDLNSDPELRYNNRPWTRALGGFWVNPTAPNVLLAILGGHQAEQMEMLSDNQIAVDLTNVLRQFTQMDVPFPNRVYRGMWFTNELFRGTYSFFSTTMARLQLTRNDLAEPEYIYRKITPNGIRSFPGLLFAGEATDINHPTTVTGALRSGFREANRIIASYKS